jgi:subtilisin family serine protease
MSGFCRKIPFAIRRPHPRTGTQEPTMQRATALPAAAAAPAAAGPRLRISLLLLAVGIAACDDTPAALDDAASPPAASIVPAQASKIGPAVREQILTNGAADVLISLNVPGQPRPDHRGPVDMAGLRGSVASTQASVLADVPAGGLRLGNRFRNIPGMSGRLESEEALDRLARHPLVVRIQLDVGGRETLTRSVPWIGADRRHANGNDGEGVTVIVMDSGADTDHPDLMDDIMPGAACFGDWDGAVDGEGFCPNGSDRQIGGDAGEDDRDHGTHVSSIITSNGTVASPGVAPGWST